MQIAKTQRNKLFRVRRSVTTYSENGGRSIVMPLLVLAIWLAYMWCWAIGLLHWGMVEGLLVFVVPAWAESGNERRV